MEFVFRDCEKAIKLGMFKTHLVGDSKNIFSFPTPDDVNMVDK